MLSNTSNIMSQWQKQAGYFDAEAWDHMAIHSRSAVAFYSVLTAGCWINFNR